MQSLQAASSLMMQQQLMQAPAGCLRITAICHGLWHLQQPGSLQQQAPGEEQQQQHAHQQAEPGGSCPSLRMGLFPLHPGQQQKAQCSSSAAPDSSWQLQPWQQGQQPQHWGLSTPQWQLQRQYKTRAHPAARRSAQAGTETDSGSDSDRDLGQQQPPPAGFQQQWRQHWQQQRAQQEQQYLSSSRSRSQRRKPSSRLHAEGADQRRGHVQANRRSQQDSRSPVDAIGITQAISAAGSLQALQHLLQQHKEHLQQIHVCAAYKAVVKLSVGLRDRAGQPHQQQPAAEDAAGGDGTDTINTTTSSSSSRAGQVVNGSTAFEVLRELSSRMQQQIRVARPWDLAQAAWACSKLHYRDQRLLEAIAQQAERKAAILTPQDISQLASAYARMSYHQPQLLKLLQTQAVAKAADFRPWVLVHTAWALHVCGQDVLPLLTVAVPLLRAPVKLQELNALDMSSLLWLLAGHSLYDEQLLHAAAGLLATHIQSYSPASVANALMACAALGFTTPALTAAATSAVLSGLQGQQYRPRQVALSVFALAKLKGVDQALLDATAEAFRQEAQAYPPPLLSMLVWVCVLGKHVPPQGFLQQLVSCSRQQLTRFSGDQLSSLLRGVLAMPEQQDSDTLLLMSEALVLLPDKLLTASTPVVTNLIISLTKRLRKMTQQMGDWRGAIGSPQSSMQTGGAGCGSADVSTSTGSSSSSSSSSSSTTTTTTSTSKAEGQQQPGSEHLVLTGMLQACVAEWTKAGRVAQLTHWQAVSVEGALRASQEDALAQAAHQVVEATQKTTAAQHQGLPAAQATSSGLSSKPTSQPGTSPGAATWIDSFVATTE